MYNLNVLEQKFLEIINNFIKKYSINNFLISLSGGVDSSVLLYIFKKLEYFFLFKVKIEAIHINHNISKYSILYENFCIKFCNELNIKIYIKKINLKKKLVKKLGFEASCRELRYKKIKKNLNKNCILVTAHNKNDNIENLFLFLNRGSGIKGLSGIKFFNNIFKINIIRPFLYFEKKIIIEYSKLNNIKYIEDLSNNNIKISRNFIRNKILPLIKSKFKNFIELSSRSINILSEQYEILKFYINKDLKMFVNKKKLLNIKILKEKKINKSYIKLIIELWLNKFDINPSYNQLNYIYDSILNSSKSSKPSIKIKNVYITKYKNYLYCINNINKNKKFFKEWKINYNLFKLPEKNGFLKKIYYLKNINKNKYVYIKIRKNRISEKIIIGTSNISYNTKIQDINFYNRKKIKKLWNLYNIPFWIRDKIPFIFYNNKLISALGVFVTFDSKIFNNNYIFIQWYNCPIINYLPNKYIG